MDCLDGAPGKLRNFKKSDFGPDWIKVAKHRFSKVYRVKLMVGAMCPKMLRYQPVGKQFLQVRLDFPLL